MAKRRRKKHRGGFGAGEHRPRVHLGGGGLFRLGPHSPYKGRFHRVNPLLREVGMLAANPHRRRRYRHNPMGGGMVGAVTSVVTRPVQSITEGLTGALAMYLTISIPNWILPFPGVDVMSKVVRLLTRVAAGGLLYGFWRTEPVKTGAMIGSVGGAVLDFIGTRVIVGSGDVGQTPLALLAPVTGGVSAYSRALVPTAGMRAYSRPVLSAARGMSARPDFPARSVFGHNLF